MIQSAGSGQEMWRYCSRRNFSAAAQRQARIRMVGLEKEAVMERRWCMVTMIVSICYSLLFYIHRS